MIPLIFFRKQLNSHNLTLNKGIQRTTLILYVYRYLKRIYISKTYERIYIYDYGKFFLFLLKNTDFWAIKYSDKWALYTYEVKVLLSQITYIHYYVYYPIK